MHWILRSALVQIVVYCSLDFIGISLRIEKSTPSKKETAKENDCESC